MKAILKSIPPILIAVFVAGCLSRAAGPDTTPVDVIYQVEAIRMKIKDDPELDFYLNERNGKFVKEADATITDKMGTMELGYSVEIEILSIYPTMIDIEYRITHQDIAGWQSIEAGTENFIRLPIIRQRFIESSSIRIRRSDDEWVDLHPKESYESLDFPVIRLKFSMTEQARERQSG